MDDPAFPHGCAQAENDSLKGSIVGSLGERGRELVAKFSPEDEGGTLVTANPTQATKVGDGTGTGVAQDEPVSRDQILRRERRPEKYSFSLFS